MSDGNSAKNDDLKIAFAAVIATFAKNCPEQAPTTLVGAGMMSGILLCLTDSPLMERVLEATLNESQLTENRTSAQGVVEMFRALEEIHDKGLAGHDAGVRARQQILGIPSSN